MPIQQMMLGSGGAGVENGSVYFDADENLHVSGGSMQVYNFDTNQSFCIEAWINMYQMSRYNYIALRWDGSHARIWRFGVDNNNKLFMEGNVSSTQSSATMTTDTWYHVACVREGTNQGYSNYLRLYINGTLVQSDSGNGASMESNTCPISIGANAESTNYSMRGYISNLRITNNEPVYTSNFTPSTTPLTTSSQVSSSANVRLLCCQSPDDVTATAHAQSGSLSIDNGTPTASSEGPF